MSRGMRPGHELHLPQGDHHLMSSPIETALAIAMRVHHSQVDKADQPYILHALRVMLALNAQAAAEHIVCAALLHDAIEDASDPVSVTVEIGKRLGLHVLTLVQTMTRGPAEEYMTYISRINRNPEAAAIKLADLADNMDPHRLAAIGRAASPQRYIDARGLLSRTHPQGPAR